MGPHPGLVVSRLRCPSFDGLVQLGEASITDLAHAQVPTHLVAADLLSGHDVLISTGDIVDGVLGSAAIPGVLPPVEHLD